MMKKCRALSIPATEVFLVVNIPSQEMALKTKEVPTQLFPVSTSIKPPSCTEDSLGTPWGLHRVEQKIGGGQPQGMVFRGRVPTGKCFQDCDEATNHENLITTRILRIRGLEEGVNTGGNRDSWNRYIYIHGTNHEDKIGSPASSGCIQLTNTDMLTVYNQVPEGSLLLIECN